LLEEASDCTGVKTHLNSLLCQCECPASALASCSPYETLNDQCECICNLDCETVGLEFGSNFNPNEECTACECDPFKAYEEQNGSGATSCAEFFALDTEKCSCACNIDCVSIAESAGKANPNLAYADENCECQYHEINCAEMNLPNYAADPITWVPAVDDHTQCVCARVCDGPQSQLNTATCLCECSDAQKEDLEGFEILNENCEPICNLDCESLGHPNPERWIIDLSTAEACTACKCDNTEVANDLNYDSTLSRCRTGYIWSSEYCECILEDLDCSSLPLPNQNGQNWIVSSTDASQCVCDLNKLTHTPNWPSTVGFVSDATQCKYVCDPSKICGTVNQAGTTNVDGTNPSFWRKNPTTC
jgi:hypothetical protein